MMAQKGEVFDDAETVSLIMNSADPKQMKSLGRKVKNFDGDVWDKVKYSVVLNGNYYKFSQNEDMRDILLATGDAVLVEASPLDTVWGIGFSRKNSAATDPGLWRGQNLLGFALMEVRERESFTMGNSRGEIMFHNNALCKEQIRGHVREELYRMQDEERRAHSEAIQQQIMDLPAWQEAKTIMLYMHMPYEVATGRLIDYLQKADRSFVVPKCQGDHIIPCRINDPAIDLAATAWGLREPIGQSLIVVNPHELDFVLVPGLAFDRQGNRIGYGRGYYDRFLRELSDRTYILPVAFSRQVVEHCPSEVFDYRVPRLLTELGLMRNCYLES